MPPQTLPWMPTHQIGFLILFTGIMSGITGIAFVRTTWIEAFTAEEDCGDNTYQILLGIGLITTGLLIMGDRAFVGIAMVFLPLLAYAIWWGTMKILSRPWENRRMPAGGLGHWIIVFTPILLGLWLFWGTFSTGLNAVDPNNPIIGGW